MICILLLVMGFPLSSPLGKVTRENALGETTFFSPRVVLVTCLVQEPAALPERIIGGAIFNRRDHERDVHCRVLHRGALAGPVEDI